MHVTTNLMTRRRFIRVMEEPECVNSSYPTAASVPGVSICIPQIDKPIHRPSSAGKRRREAMERADRRDGAAPQDGSPIGTR